MEAMRTTICMSECWTMTLATSKLGYVSDLSWIVKADADEMIAYPNVPFFLNS